MIIEEVTDIAPKRFNVLGKVLLSEVGSGGGTTPPRCPDSGCQNPPTTIAINFTITGTFPTSAECNLSEPHTVDISGGTASPVNVVEQDTIDGCNSYTISTEVAPFPYVCANVDCNDTTYPFCLIELNCVYVLDSGIPGDWYLNIAIEDGSPICAPGFPPFGGEFVVADVNLGTSPYGTHSFSLDDAEYSTLHYEFTVVIT